MICAGENYRISGKGNNRAKTAMSRISKKRKVTTLVYYVCAIVAVALLWMHKTSIWVGTIVFLNSLVETFDSLAGK